LVFLRTADQLRREAPFAQFLDHVGEPLSTVVAQRPKIVVGPPLGIAILGPGVSDDLDVHRFPSFATIVSWLRKPEHHDGSWDFLPPPAHRRAIGGGVRLGVPDLRRR